MEIHLEELLEKIKKDGVEAAESQAKAIIDAVLYNFLFFILD